MQYTLIAQYGNEGWFDLSGHPADPGLPIPSLIEDEHGQRILLCRSLIPQQAWLDAVESGAQGLLRAGDGPTAYMSAATFLSCRTTNIFAAAYEVPEEAWFLTQPDAFFTMDMLSSQRPSLTTGFVHLHTHTEFSSFDGMTLMDELIKAVSADGQPAVGISDHGNVAGHPALRKAADGSGVKPIYGMEAYFRDDRFSTEGGQFGYQHLCLWAQDDQGLSDLWALSTEGYRDGFYGKPCIDWDSLARFGSHLLASTGCLGGPLLAPYLAGDEQRGLASLARLGDIFEDRLYIELHTNHLDDQLRGNDWLVGVAKKYKVPLLAAVDSHYALASEKDKHRAWIAMQTAKDVEDETELFGNESYHLMTAAEVRQQLAYLGKPGTAAIANTVSFAERCTAEIKPRKVLPLYSKASPERPDRFQHDVERFVDGAFANWDERITQKLPPGADQTPYLKLAEHESRLMIEKKFPGYYLMTADFVTWAKDRGILVGPGRGSGAASLFAYLLRITEVDPIQGELLFDRFMTEGRESLPDFDVDFPSSRTTEVIGYVGQRWGEDHIARVGSHTRVKNKSAFKDVQRSIASRLPSDSFVLVNQISRIIDEAESTTAGLGLSWDDLFAQVGDLLEPYREKMPELFELAEHFRGRLKGYGKHAAGIVIDPDNSLAGMLPLRNAGEGEPMVTQFDMETLEYLGQIKFDMLSIKALDRVQDTIDLIEKEHGLRINPYDWSESHEYSDPELYDKLGAGHTLGVFQIETNLGTRTTKQIQPRSRFELTDVITVGRPGPMRSGLDKLYMRRRAGEEPVTYADPRLEQILGKTWGVMLYQEDIMAVCITLAGYTSDEADDVRRILGKKKVEQAKIEGRRFIERARANGTDQRVAEEIWVQMEEFAKYSFGRAHAYSYATLSCWTGWLSTHFARESLTSIMASVDKERIPQFVAEARRLGYRVLPPDINISGAGFTAKDLEIRYGLESVSGVGAAASKAILAARSTPFADYDDFLVRRDTKCNMGHIKKLVRVGAFDSVAPNRRALEHRIDDDVSGVSVQCIFKDPAFTNDHGLPCHFDWASEPILLGKTGKPLKNQPKVPAKCTKACRHYTPKPPTDYSYVAQYTEAEIREIEFAMLGVYLSSSPFDIIPEDIMSQMLTADELTTAEFGVYLTVAIISSVRSDPQGRDFGFVTCSTAAGEFSAIVFSKQWEAYRSILQRGRMVLAEVVKQEQDRFRIYSLEAL